MGRFVIAKSPDGENDWQLVKPEDVPAWLKELDVMAAMADGHIAHDTAEPESPWFCAVRLPDKAANDESVIVPNRDPVATHRPLVVIEGGIPTVEAFPPDAA